MQDSDDNSNSDNHHCQDSGIQCGETPSLWHILIIKQLGHSLCLRE